MEAGCIGILIGVSVVIGVMVLGFAMLVHALSKVWLVKKAYFLLYKKGLYPLVRLAWQYGRPHASWLLRAAWRKVTNGARQAYQWARAKGIIP